MNAFKRHVAILRCHPDGSKPNKSIGRTQPRGQPLQRQASDHIDLLLGRIAALESAATFIPVLGGVAWGIGMDPLALLVPAALAATCAFMLPVGTPPNAIAFSSGAVSIGQMARGGVVLNLLGIALITGAIYLLGSLALGLELG